MFLLEGGWPLLATLDLRLVPGVALFSPRRTGRSRFNLLKSRGLRRFQIGFVWRFFRFLDVLSVNVRIRPCHRFAAVACYAATQAHPVLVIRHLASAIRHMPLAIHHSSGSTRWTRVVQFPGLPIPFRASLGPDPAWAKLVCVPASGIASPPMSRPRRPGIGFVVHKQARIYPTLTL